MKTMKSFLQWLVLPATVMAMTACSSSEDLPEVAGAGGNDGFVETTQTEWQKGGFEMDDLDMMVDIAVKTEAIRLEFVKMMSNGWEGELFSGAGAKSDPERMMDIVCDMLENQEQYVGAVGRLSEAKILTPTVTRGTIGDIEEMLTAMSTAAEEERMQVLKYLGDMGAMGNEDAQRDLYNYLPDNLKAKATDHKDFFRKLNKGELNGSIFKISHNWRDVGKLEADGHQHPYVDAYAELADEEGIPYLKRAAEVSGKIAKSAGSLYFTAIDKAVGGYGAKILELGEVLDNKLKMLDFAGQLMEGKVDLQDVNTFIVSQILGDLQSALGDVVGDDSKVVSEMAGMIAEYYADYIKEQCTTKGGEKTDLIETAKEYGNTIIDVLTDVGTTPKAVFIQDTETGKIVVGIPDKDGKVSIPTGAGNKMITIIDEDGNRKTQEIYAEEGATTVDATTKKPPYVDTNPSTVELEAQESSDRLYVLTNCKYVKLNTTGTGDWLTVTTETVGGKTLVNVTAKTNIADLRTTTFVIEGYNDKETRVASKTVTISQEGGGSLMSVTPKSLTYSAEGGTQTVAFEPADYKIHNVLFDVNCGDWVSVKQGKGWSIEVTVKPNATGAKREATIYLEGKNKEDAPWAEIDLLPIPITQLAGGDVAVDVDIRGVNFGGMLYCVKPDPVDEEDAKPRQTYVGIRVEPQTFGNKYPGEITGKLKNGVLHVEVENKQSDISQWLSFDIVGYTSTDESLSTVTNLQYMNNSTGVDATLEVPEIPFYEDLSYGSLQIGQWRAEGGSIALTSYEYNGLSYVSHNSNYLSLRVDIRKSTASTSQKSKIVLR